jgi:CHAD domain-containing protein
VVRGRAGSGPETGTEVGTEVGMAAGTEVGAETEVEAGTEVERKFGVDEAYAVPDLSDLVTVREEGTDHLVTTYLDTADLRLWRDGIVLRHRAGGPDAGWHLKFPPVDRARSGEQQAAGARSDAQVRAEVRLPARRGDSVTSPPAELLGLVRVSLAGEQVGPRGRIRTARTRQTLLTPHGTELAELADDHVTYGPAEADDRLPTSAQPSSQGTTSAQQSLQIPTPAQPIPQGATPVEAAPVEAAPVGAFREIELEERDAAATPEGQRLLDAVAARLTKTGAQPPAATSKAVRVLGDPADLPPVLPPTSPLSPDAPAAAAVRAHLAKYTLALRREDLRVRLDAEDSVHQLRVATRRLRSGLRAFRPLFVPGWTDPLRTELRWLATSFAPTRDAEVQLARLVDRAGRLPEPGASAEVQGYLRERLGQELTTSRNASLAVLETERYLALHHLLLDAVTAPAVTDAAADPCARVLPPLARRAYVQLEKAARNLAADAPAARWHEVRITAKRARYAAEACVPALGKPAKALSGQLSRVTDVLGEHQDAVVAAATLARLANSGRVPARVAYWLGVLHSEERAAATAAREAFAGVWRDAGQPAYRRWLDEGP